MARRRVAILISGRGSNMTALVEAARAKDYPADIVLVISNIAGASTSVAGRTVTARRGIWWLTQQANRRTAPTLADEK